MVGFDPTTTDVTFPGQIIMDYVSIKNAAARNATCNDGTAAGYYLHMSPTNSTKWMIYLEGGGLCYDLESCTKRPKILTSSTPWPKQLGAYGILNNLTTNQFNDFNKVGAGACSVVCGAHAYQRGIPFAGDRDLLHIRPVLWHRSAGQRAAGVEFPRPLHRPERH